VRPAPALLGVVGVVGAFLGVRALSDATLSTHTEIAADTRIEVVVNVDTNGGEIGQSIDEMVEAQIVICRLEVHSDIVGEIEPLGDDHHFRAVLSPSMDHTDQRQFRGCLEDWIIDHMKLDVVRLTPLDSS
jgi:hypothetical protein